jgi:hypothetical protein
MSKEGVFGLICVMFVLAATSCGDVIEEGKISTEQVAKKTQPSILVFCGIYWWYIDVDCSEMEFPEMMETCANDGGCNSTGCIHNHGSECYMPELGDAICLEGDTLKCVCGCHSPGGP